MDNEGRVKRLLTKYATNLLKREKCLAVIIPDQFVNIRISLNDLARVSAEEHRDVCVRVTLAENRQHGEREDDVAKTVGAD